MTYDRNGIPPEPKFIEDCKCGCGKQGRYICRDDDGKEVYSCNKYQRCPTYEELDSMYMDYRDKFLKLKYAADILMNYREGTAYYKQAEQIIKEMKR